MRKLLAVTACELRERWLLFPAALVIGFFPLVLPAFGVPRDAAPAAGLMGAVLLGAAAGIIIGASMLARDAANGRLGFLFSRPVPWPAIWGGKWLAALVAVVASAFLAMIPWMAAFPLASLGGRHGDSWLRAMLDGQGAVYTLTLMVLAVGLANFGATAFRSRSPWVALDLALLLVAFWAVRRDVAPLWWYGIFSWSGWSLALSLLPLGVAVVVGSVAQVAVGRTDLHRAHRALSAGFWTVVALALAVAAGYWAWVRSAGPTDVSVHALTHDPAGRWAYLEGSRPGRGWYPHTFLVDTTNGRYAVPAAPRLDGPAVGLLFSADGRVAALPYSDGRGTAIALYELTGAAPRVTEVALESSPPPTWDTVFALSPSATLVFAAHESGASLFALPSGRRVATTTIGPGWRPSILRFVAEGSARAWLVPSPRARAEMRVLDLATDGSSRAVTFPIATSLDRGRSWGAIVPDAEGRRIVTVDAGLHLRDGATGDLVATLAEGAGRLSATFLGDGRVVVGEGRLGTGEALLRVFDQAGARLAEAHLDLPPAGFGVGPEVAPGRIVVSSTFRAGFPAEDAVLVDVDEGRVVERLAGLRPAMGFWFASTTIPAGAEPGPVHFFRDAEGRVIRIDFATGERRIVAGPGAPRGQRVSLAR